MRIADQPDRLMPSSKKKPARELRQEGSYYRCCIPALAGFVSPQSIAPDGGEISSRHRHAQLKNAAPISALLLSLSCQPNGRFAFTLATSVPSTRAALASRRLRFALFVDNRWRRDGRALKTLPLAVILKRLATDLRVLLRAMGFGIRQEC